MDFFEMSIEGKPKFYIMCNFVQTIRSYGNYVIINRRSIYNTVYTSTLILKTFFSFILQCY